MSDLVEKMVPVLKKHGVVRAGLFGSVVREDFGEESDVDVLVDYPGGKSLLDVIGLQLELEEVLKRSVDVVHYNRLRERIRKSVLDDEVRIYEKR